MSIYSIYCQTITIAGSSTTASTITMITVITTTCAYDSIRNVTNNEETQVKSVCSRVGYVAQYRCRYSRVEPVKEDS